MNGCTRWMCWVMLLCMIGCEGPGQLLPVAEVVSKDDGPSSRSSLAGARRADLRDVVVGIDPAGVVTFSYRLEGALVPYDRQYQGEVIAREQSEGRIGLFLQRDRSEPAVEIGLLDHGELKLCGRFEIDGAPRELACDAIFLHSPEHPRPLPDGSYPFRFPVIIGVGHSATAKSASGATIDLQALALPQINQYGTGTCYFNSTTGILEWFYKLRTGRALDLSEPALVGALENGEMGAINDYNLVEKTGALDGVVQDALMPRLDYYTPDAGFEEVEERASGELLGLPAARRVALPFTLRIEPLFWYGRWQSGHTTEADYQRVTAFLAEKRRPIHLQHVVSGYWHAVVLLGHNPRTGELLVKDSLGNTNVTATWRSKQWFLETSYGAVGVTEQGQPRPPEEAPFDPDAVSIHGAFAPWGADPDWTVMTLTLEGEQRELSQVAAVRYRVEGSSLDRTVETAENHFRFRIRTTLGRLWLLAELSLKDGRRFEKRVEVEIEDPAPRALTAADFQVGVDSQESGVAGYQGFSLHLEASPAALGQVVRVVYWIHPTFGAYRTFTADDPADGFTTTRYLTYARDWTTEGTEITLADGRTLRLPGTRIRW